MHLFSRIEGYREGHEKLMKPWPEGLDGMPLPSGGAFRVRYSLDYDFTFPEEDLAFVAANFQHNHIYTKERPIDPKAGKWLNNSYPFKKHFIHIILRYFIVPILGVFGFKAIPILPRAKKGSKERFLTDHLISVYPIAILPDAKIWNGAHNRWEEQI